MNNFTPLLFVQQIYVHKIYITYIIGYDFSNQISKQNKHHRKVF